MKTLQEINDKKAELLDAFKNITPINKQLGLECMGAIDALAWVSESNENLIGSLIANIEQELRGNK
jgi:hypothetical protein